MSTHSQTVFSPVSRRKSKLHSAAQLHRRAAFTLVELLVVITIIGMLAALLMPAINRSRENGRQAACINNQRQIGSAVQQHVTSKGEFPGYRSLIPITSGPPRCVVGTWQMALLVRMGRNDLYEAIQAGNQNLPYMELTICPSDTSGAGTSDPWTSYVANAGRLDFSMGGDVPDLKHNGLFHDHIRPKSDVNRYLKVTNTDIKDGQSMTLMISENVDANYYGEKQLTWIPGTPTTIINNLDGQAQTINAMKNATERGAGFVWWDLPDPSTAPPPPAPVNSRHGEFDVNMLSWPSNPYTATLNETNMNLSARPASSHPNGVIVTFADGHTKLLSDTIEYKVYCLLMTPYGAKAQTMVPAWQKTETLNEGDF